MKEWSAEWRERETIDTMAVTGVREGRDALAEQG